MKINEIDTTKGGTINAFIEWLWYRGYNITKADAPNANFECFEATITDQSGYNTIKIFFGGETPKITARVDKINGTHKWYYGKTISQMMAIVRQCMEGYKFEEHTTEPTEEKEEETMENTEVTLNTPKTFEREGGRSAVTITKLWRRFPTDNWTLMDDDHSTWYRKPEWDEDGKIAYYMPDSVKGQRILMTQQELDNMINNMKEEDTMETIITFEIDETTYTHKDGTAYYYKTTSIGKKVRISKAEFEEAKTTHDLAWAAHEQEKLDEKPCRIEVNSDLHVPAVLNEFGCVDCSKCNVTGCVHRNCMRRNPRKVGGLGECPRLDVKPIVIDEGVVDTELEEIINETGLEPADAELERNIRKEQKSKTSDGGKKKASKPRRSKDIAYEAHGVTLTAKQVDFIKHLPDTDYWENGLDSCIWTDILCDQIGGQFADKPMTVGAMISTLCEKGLGVRGKEKMNGRKATFFSLTEMGKKVAGDLGLA